tara:strand:- start:1223 stop:2434 length:1212 start_codon:yes stop_codon:yes gene_type:complete
MSKNSANSQPKQVYHDGFIYEEDVNDLFVTYRQIDKIKEQETLAPKWLGEPIPLKMWKEILAFMKQSQEAFKSETLAFLYYDVSKKQPWSYWVPPQETAGMTVKSLPDDSLWREQRKAFPDTQFGTVHHHCTSSAFQSGTDEADEVNREGLHFTVGKLHTVDDIDVHFRLSIGGHCVDMDAGTYIEMSETPFKKTCRVTDDVQAQVRSHLHTLDITSLPDDWETMDFTVQMNNVHKKTYSYTTTNHGKYSTGTQTVLGYGYDYDYSSKKKFDEIEDMALVDSTLSPNENLADDFIEAIMTDYQYEQILEDYYVYKNDHQKKTGLLTGSILSTEICSDLCKMFEDDGFSATSDYKTVDNIVQSFLMEQSTAGLSYTHADLLNGLQSLNHEERSGVQFMDKENVL